MRRTASIAGLVLALIAAACAPVAPAAPASGGTEPVRGGTLIFASAKELANSHPFIATSSVSLYIKELMYESLLAFDDESQLQGMLAESWQGADGGRTWTFKLRKGVKFHDGKEMTAKDVVWSVNYVQDPNNGAGGKAIIESIQKVEAVDQYTVRFTLTGPSAIFPSLVGNIRAVAVIPEGSLPPGSTKVEGAPPPGTGPFTFEKWVPGDQTSFKRFDGYWDGPPYLDRVVFKLIANDTARVNALRAGDIQVAERAGVEFIRRIDAGEVKGIKYQPARLSGFRRLVFNHTSPVFKDRTMREAVAYAIDPKRFMDEVYFGYGVITKLKMPPGSAWEKGAALPDRPRDVAKAKQLLQRAGYTGQQISGIGRRGEHEEIWESIVLMLKEAGINVKVEITESGVYDNRQQKADFDLTLRGGRTAEDPSDGLKQDYYCEAGPERFANFAGYCSKTVDKLFDALEVEPDIVKRMAIFKELANTMYADVVEVPLGYTGDRFFVWLDPLVQGFQGTDGGSYTSRYGGIKRTWFKK